jgi:signal transduction histidine kinase
MSTSAPVVVVAALASNPKTATSTAVILTLAVVITSVYVYGLAHDFSPFASVVDAVGLVVLILSTSMMTPAEWLVGGKSWLVSSITAACVAYQYHLDATKGVTLTVGVHGALAAGIVLGLPLGAPSFGVISVFWSLAITLLGRMLWTLVLRSGQAADAALAEVVRLRIDQQVAQAVRADERAFANALHDTAATTLLMVGLGQARRGGVLSRQARRDLMVLGTYGERLPDRLCLVSLIRSIVDLVPLKTKLYCPEDLFLPSRAATIIAEATAEAVHNAVRHARTSTITIHVSVDGDDPSAIVVEIVDFGIGFDTNQVPDTRRGLRDSVQGRMTEIGGDASIASEIGYGTTVRLSWFHGG